MQTASIVIVFDEFLDALDQVFQIAVVVGVYLLPFQCLHKALATGVGMSVQLRRMAMLKFDVFE
jgi:hypothetical protein